MRGGCPPDIQHSGRAGAQTQTKSFATQTREMGGMHLRCGAPVPPTLSRSPLTPLGSQFHAPAVYYAKLFPHAAFFEWLSYGHGGAAVGAERLGAFLCKREISFTLEDDVYVRYQSYKSADELRKGICTRLPHKIDIGPVYTVDPQRRAAYAGGAFRPLEREFVIDVDLTDYGDIYPEVDPPKPQKFQVRARVEPRVHFAPQGLVPLTSSICLCSSSRTL